MSRIGDYVKENRRRLGITQEEFAVRSGLGLRFVRELEQGKKTVRMDKVNQALQMFGMEAIPGPVSQPQEASPADSVLIPERGKKDGGASSSTRSHKRVLSSQLPETVRQKHGAKDDITESEDSPLLSDREEEDDIWLL